MKQQFEEITITKPLYDTYCCIRDIKIERAIKEGRQLLIKIPKGQAIHDPKKWKKTGKRIEKVFLFENNPMILYCNYVKLERIKTEDEKLEEMSRLKVFG